VLPTSVALGAGAAIAYAAIPAADGTIGACYVPNQSVRVVDGPDNCRTSTGEGAEQFLRFNQTGPRGLQGPAGPAGAAGAPGGPGGLGVPTADPTKDVEF